MNTINDRGRIDQVKGILACAIIIRHVDGFLELIPWLMVVLSAFCSYDFFLLGFLSDRPKHVAGQLQYSLKKFYWPFLLFFTFSCILFFVIVDHTNIRDSFVNYFIGLGIQSAETLKAASGFSLFWFIPCYVLLTLIRSIGLQNKYLFYTVLSISLVFHFGGARYLSTLFGTFPFSFNVALYCYPVCLLFNKIKSLLISNRLGKYICGVLFVLSCIYIVKTHSSLFFSSNIFPDYKDPLGILIHDVCALSSIGAFSLVYDFVKSGLMMKVGRLSFEFYLIHQFANYLVIYGVGKLHGYWAIHHACFVIALTMLAVWVLKRFKAYEYIFSVRYSV